MQVSVFSGISTSMFLRLCSVAPSTRSFCPLPRLRRRRHRDRQIAAQILRRQRALVLQQVLERARKHDAPALLARAEAQVDDRVADANHVFVVLDDQHGVALVAQLPEDVDQPQVVARVQADGRLVEHVERVDQRRSERGRQVDALRLAARQRRRQPVERQVVEPDVAQKLQPLLDFLEHLVADRRFLLGQLQRPRNCSASRTVSDDT